jgi:hypothetical protein
MSAAAKVYIVFFSEHPAIAVRHWEVFEEETEAQQWLVDNAARYNCRGFIRSNSELGATAAEFDSYLLAKRHVNQCMRAADRNRHNDEVNTELDAAFVAFRDESVKLVMKFRHVR